MARKPGTGQSKKRVLVVDDHPVVRQGVAMLVNHEADMEVCGESDSAPGALAAVAKLNPDLVVMDLSLGDGNGLDLIKDLRIRYPKLPILVLSMHDESFYAERVLRAGARGYIAKGEGTDMLVGGIRRVLGGELFLSDNMASKMIGKVIGEPDGQITRSVEGLTDRELQVFELIGSGVTTGEIARRLHLSVKTVDSHREHIKRKLSLDNAAELVKHAVQWVNCR